MIQAIRNAVEYLPEGQGLDDDDFDRLIEAFVEDIAVTLVSENLRHLVSARRSIDKVISKR